MSSPEHALNLAFYSAFALMVFSKIYTFPYWCWQLIQAKRPMLLLGCVKILDAKGVFLDVQLVWLEGRNIFEDVREPLLHCNRGS
jgi:hypothetical protein